MSRAAARFRKADIERAVRAAQAAGLGIARIEIDPEGKIVIVPGQAAPPEKVDELAAWRAKRDARAS